MDESLGHLKKLAGLKAELDENVVDTRETLIEKSIADIIKSVSDRFRGKSDKERVEPTFDTPKPQDDTIPVIKTNDPKLDATVNQILKSKGKDAAIKFLQDYKAKLSLQSDDPFDQFKGEMRKLAGITGARPLPAVGPTAKFASELKGDLAKIQKGDKETGSYLANKILKYAKAGYDVSGPAKAWLNSARVGERALSVKEYKEITEVLKEFDLDWQDIGLIVRLDESADSVVFLSTKE